MTYWAEIKRLPGTRKLKLCAMWDSTSKLKPSPKYGGDDCISITEDLYNILRITHGDVHRAREIVRKAAKLFINEDDKQWTTQSQS